MKKLFNYSPVFILLLLFTLETNHLTAQNVAINSDGSAPEASAALDVKATGKGMLIPRMTKAERPVSPVNGLMIYQTDETPGFYFYKETAWTRVIDSTTNSGGTIIPFSSGSAVTLTCSAAPMTSAIVGFGSAQSIPFGNITDGNAASFIAPRSGIITSISGQFTFSQTTNVPGIIIVSAKIYSAAPNVNIFTATTAAVTLSFPGTSPSGSTAASLAQLNLPVTAGYKYLMVIYTTNTFSFASAVTGYFSGGMNIY